MEYSHSRLYQPGDSLRRLDHRASSRLGQPLSKIFEGAEEVRRDQVYLIVDLGLRPFQRWQRRPVDSKPLDRRLALAVEIGLSAQNEGFTLAALATGNQWHELQEPGEFDQRIATCLPEKIPEHAVAGNAHNLPEQVLNPEGLQVLVIGRWSEEAKAQVDRWQKAGILTLVFMLPESEADRGTLPVGPQFVEVLPEVEPSRKGGHA